MTSSYAGQAKQFYNEQAFGESIRQNWIQRNYQEAERNIQKYPNDFAVLFKHSEKGMQWYKDYAAKQAERRAADFAFGETRKLIDGVEHVDFQGLESLQKQIKVNEDSFLAGNKLYYQAIDKYKMNQTDADEFRLAGPERRRLMTNKLLNQTKADHAEWLAWNAKNNQGYLKTKDGRFIQINSPRSRADKQIVNAYLTDELLKAKGIYGLNKNYLYEQKFYREGIARNEAASMKSFLRWRNSQVQGEAELMMRERLWDSYERGADVNWDDVIRTLKSGSKTPGGKELRTFGDVMNAIEDDIKSIAKVNQNAANYLIADMRARGYTGADGKRKDFGRQRLLELEEFIDGEAITQRTDELNKLARDDRLDEIAFYQGELSEDEYRKRHHSRYGVEAGDPVGILNRNERLKADPDSQLANFNKLYANGGLITDEDVRTAHPDIRDQVMKLKTASDKYAAALQEGRGSAKAGFTGEIKTALGISGADKLEGSIGTRVLKHMMRDYDNQVKLNILKKMPRAQAIDEAEKYVLTKWKADGGVPLTVDELKQNYYYKKSVEGYNPNYAETQIEAGMLIRTNSNIDWTKSDSIELDTSFIKDLPQPHLNNLIRTISPGYRGHTSEWLDEAYRGLDNSIQKQISKKDFGRMILRNAGYDVSKKSQLENDLAKDYANASPGTKRAINNLIAYGGMANFTEVRMMLQLENGDPTGSVTGSAVAPYIIQAVG